jgi:hypothetical protein
MIKTLHLTIVYLLLVVFTPGIPVNDFQQDGFKSIFNGKSLDGWEGDPLYWRVENGCLVGEVTPTTLLQRNSFITWTGGSTQDFELILEYRVSKSGNSGINYRSELIKELPFALRGYQADIDGANQYTGSNYEERRRTTLAAVGQAVVVKPFPVDTSSSKFEEYITNNSWTAIEVTRSLGNSDSLRGLIKAETWNQLHLLVKGYRMQHFVNGVLMSEVTDNDSIHRRASGLLGVQVHVGPPMKVEFRNIRIRHFR